jgi:regulatory protein
MKITKITQQQKRADRYSVFVDDNYSFSLSESALLESKIHSGQELTKEQVGEFKKLSADDKLYNQTLRYVAMRPRTGWEIETYLERKGGSPALIEQIVNKLTNIGLIDDAKFALAFVADRRLLRPTSRRKLVVELRKKHISSELIEQVVGNEKEDERTSLAEVIAKKRKQTKYQDDLRLMRYLASQGFNYDDIKHELNKDQEY